MLCKIKYTDGKNGKNSKNSKNGLDLSIKAFWDYAISRWSLNGKACYG